MRTKTKSVLIKRSSVLVAVPGQLCLDSGLLILARCQERQTFSDDSGPKTGPLALRGSEFSKKLGRAAGGKGFLGEPKSQKPKSKPEISQLLRVFWKL